MSMSRSLMLALPLCALTACGGFDFGGGEGELGIAMPSTLRLELRNDNAGGGSNGASGLQEAIAVVHAAAAHVAGSGWHTIMEGHVEVDFLRLADSAADLGIANIPPGKVTQLRLYVLDDEDAYVTDADGVRHPLLTPSGSESGIKVKGLWSLGECEAGTLVLSTNGKKAIHIHGRGADDSYILRPVIRADGLETEDIEGCVPGGPGDGSDDGDVPGGPGDGSDDGTPGDDDGDGEGDVPGGEGEEGGDCYNPETGLVGACDGSGDDGGDLGGTGTGNDPAGGGDDGSGDPDGSGTGSGDTGSGGTGDPDGSGTGSGDTGSGGTGDPDGSGTGSGDTGSGDTGDPDGSGTGSGDTGSGGSDGSGGDTESDLCYDPEGGFVTCPG